MFGHKSSNQTTVGTAVVQSPSMLDNVSTEDFSGSNSGAPDVQQQVQDALSKRDMQTMLDSATSSTPVVANGTFMASPSAAPTAVVASEPDSGVPTVMPVPEPVADPVPQPADGSTPEPAVEEVSDADIPRPLSPEENKEIEAHPIISSVSSPASSTEEVASPSAPIAPPPPPAPVDTAPAEAAVESVAEPALELPAVPSVEDTPPSSETTEEVTPVADPVVDDAPSDPPSEPDESQAEEPSVGVTTDADSAPEIDTDKLAGMKQQALEHLEPLVDHLDQTPEEEFRTTMMRIQANDNHTLLERAFDAAKRITDDKERAQAMLDIVNEINYFSQKN